MKTTMMFTLLLGFASLAEAQDARGGLLEQLQEETRALTAVADRVVVRVSSAVNSRRDLTDPRHAAAQWAYLRLSTTVQVQPGTGLVEGVLVGTPPRVVVPHAFGTATTIAVHFPDGKRIKATRVAADEDLGIAVFKLPDSIAKDLKGVAPETDWSRLQVGSLAVLKGAEKGIGPLGLTLVRGVDRAFGRLDAATGTSGAALIGTGKTLLGIRARAMTTAQCASCHTTANTQGNLLVTASRFYRAAESGLAAHTAPVRNTRSPHFVPGPVIARVLKDLDEHGRIRHGYLGVVLGDAAMGDGRNAVVVNAALDDSPASKAGIERGERILTVSGQTITNAALFSRALALRLPGEVVTLQVANHAGDKREVKVTLGDRADAKEGALGLDSIGLHCVDLTDGVRAFLGLGSDVNGVVVQHVAKGGCAARVGMRRGDVVTEAGLVVDAGAAVAEEVVGLDTGIPRQHRYAG